LKKKDENMFDKYKDRGHLIQDQDYAEMSRDDRPHLLQSRSDDHQKTIEDRGHFLQK
jgi:hypothetical protein